jgi:hypothetical protein
MVLKSDIINLSNEREVNKMTITNNKVIFKFTKEDVMALRQLADMLSKECDGCVKFSDIMYDIIKENPDDRIYDFTEFETFSIEIEK